MKMGGSRLAPRRLIQQFESSAQQVLKLLSLSPLQFTGEGISRIGDQSSKTFGTDAVPTKGDRRLLFEQDRTWRQ